MKRLLKGALGGVYLIVFILVVVVVIKLWPAILKWVIIWCVGCGALIGVCTLIERLIDRAAEKKADKVEAEEITEIPFCQVFKLDEETYLQIDTVAYTPDEIAYFRIGKKDLFRGLSFSGLQRAKIYTDADGMKYIRYKKNNYYLDESETQPQQLYEEEKIDIDSMEGADFERFCADLLRIHGYTDLYITPGSGDQGIDITAEKDGLKWGFQCKRWGIETNIGNNEVMQTFAGKAFYHCDIGVVITTSNFTRKAEEYAQQTGILLWGRKKLMGLMEEMEDRDSYYFSRTA